MQTLVSFPASGTPLQELGPILSDYLALDRARIVRRLMVARFGVLALLAVLLETIREFSPFARVFTMALCLLPPFWARIVELGRGRRLSQRIERVDGAVTTNISTSVRRLSGSGIKKS